MAPRYTPWTRRPQAQLDNALPTTYGGPETPTAYDSNWQRFTNLTPIQIAWFRAQPEWQNFLTYVTLSPSAASAATSVIVVNDALQMAGKSIATA